MKIRNVSGEDRSAPWLGGRLVLAGQIVECAPDMVYAHTSAVGTWEPADDEAQGEHDKGSKDEAKRVREAAGLPAEEPAAPAWHVPVKSASKADWYEAALHVGVPVAEAQEATQEQLQKLVSDAMNGDSNGSR